MNKAQHGNVTIELVDEEIELKCTLRAFMKIENRFGGLRPAISALSQFSLEAATQIIAAGTGTDSKGLEDLREKVFQTGVVTVTPDLTKYLTAMMNPTGKGEEEGEEGEAPGE